MAKKTKRIRKKKKNHKITKLEIKLLNIKKYCIIFCKEIK